MPARAHRLRPANQNTLADSVAHAVGRLPGAGHGIVPPVFEEVPGLRYFHKVPARLLRKYRGHSIGELVRVELMPNGCFYLIDDAGYAFDDDAFDGRDFDFLSERL